MILSRVLRRFSTIPSWATVDPNTLSGSNPHTVKNFLNGKQFKTTGTNLHPVVDPMNGETFINVEMVSEN